MSTRPDTSASCAHSTAVTSEGTGRTTSTRRGRGASEPLAERPQRDARRGDPGLGRALEHLRSPPRHPRETWGGGTPAGCGEGPAAMRPPQGLQNPSPFPAGRGPRGPRTHAHSQISPQKPPHAHSGVSAQRREGWFRSPPASCVGPRPREAQALTVQPQQVLPRLPPPRGLPSRPKPAAATGRALPLQPAEGAGQLRGGKTHLYSSVQRPATVAWPL